MRRHSLYLAGFTLIELLIAMAISAILATGTFYLVQVSRNTYQSLTLNNDYRSQLTRVMRVMENDFSQWVPERPVKDAFGDDQGALVLDDIEGLYLTRNGWNLSQFVELERSSMQRVNYQLVEEGRDLCPQQANPVLGEAGGCLIRSHLLQLDDDGGLEWRHQLLLRPVKALDFSFMARLGDETTRFERWPPSANSNNSRQPDLFAIQVNLQTGKGDQIERLIAVPRASRSEIQAEPNNANN